MTVPRTRPTGNLPVTPSRLPLFHLHGTRDQDRIVQGALDRCDFPWHLLRPGLWADTGRERIPVEWADLSGVTYSEVATPAGERATVIHTPAGPSALAWRSGRVTLDHHLTRTYAGPGHEIAHDLRALRAFLTAAAHMVDLFWLSDRQRDGVWSICHDGGYTPPEAFLAAFTDLPTRIHPRAAAAIRATMLGTTDGMPAPYISTRRVWHHPACPTVPLIRHPLPAGYLPPPHMRPCRLCRPDRATGIRRGDDGL